MRILNGKLQRRAQLVRIKRAVTGLIYPAGIIPNKALIANFPPSANPRRIARQPDTRTRLTVICCPFARKPYRHIGIAFAGGKTVTHANDQEVLDLDPRFGNRLPTDKHTQQYARRIWNGKFNGNIARHSQGLDRWFAPRFDALSPPSAVYTLVIAHIRQLRNNLVLLGIDISPAGRTGMLIALALPTQLINHRRRPAIAVTLLQGSLGR